MLMPTPPPMPMPMPMPSTHRDRSRRRRAGATDGTDRRRGARRHPDPRAAVLTGRELLVLGTAARAPTRRRNPNGYLFRWNDQAVLVDPGEGTQIQLVRAGVSPHRVNHICITHLHGDHCLGLPGVLEQVMADDGHEVTVHVPASSIRVARHLCQATLDTEPAVRLDPVPARPGGAWTRVVDEPTLRISARPLEHSVDTVGWRIEEPARRHIDPERARRAGVRGPDLGRLQRDGQIDVGGNRITLEELSADVDGFCAAVVMDTRMCDAAVELADGADLLLCEATFLDADADLARASGHLTARQAATIARLAGARLLVLTHFSSRYDDTDGHRREAEAVFPNVRCAEDLDVVPFTGRHVPISLIASHLAETIGDR